MKKEKEIYNKWIENKKEFIKRFEKFRPTNQQMIQDYENALKEVKYTFEEWKKEQEKVMNVGGIKLK